jgi:hypothetical protein
VPAAQCRQEALVAGDDHAGPLIPPDDQPEEEAGLEVGERQVANLVDDQDLGVGKLLQAALQPALLGGSHQTADEFLQGQEEHGVAGFHSLDPQGDGQVRLAHARRAEDDDVVGPLHEAYAGEFADLTPVEARPELDVELIQRLEPGEASLAQPDLNASLVTSLPFGLQRLNEKGLVIHLALRRLLADGIQLRLQVVHLQLLEQVV